MVRAHANIRLIRAASELQFETLSSLCRVQYFLMAQSAIPSAVNDFICERVHSIEQLEVLCLLHADRSGSWTSQAVAEAVRITQAQAISALEHLEEQRLVLAGGPQHGSYRYAPASDELATLVNDTVATYSSSRVEILMLISRCAMDRIRNAQVRTFAQAFLLRSPKKDGRS